MRLKPAGQGWKRHRQRRKNTVLKQEPELSPSPRCEAGRARAGSARTPPELPVGPGRQPGEGCGSVPVREPPGQRGPWAPVPGRIDEGPCGLGPVPQNRQRGKPVSVPLVHRTRIRLYGVGTAPLGPPAGCPGWRAPTREGLVAGGSPGKHAEPRSRSGSGVRGRTPQPCARLVLGLGGPWPVGGRCFSHMVLVKKRVFPAGSII